MNKFLGEEDKAALYSAFGVSLVPLFLQAFIPGGPLVVFLICMILGYASYKIISNYVL